MTTITITDADITALGGLVPRRGRIQVWVGDRKETTFSLRSSTVELTAGAELRLEPFPDTGLSGPWTVQIPDTETTLTALLSTASTTQGGTRRPARWALVPSKEIQ